MEEIRAVTFFKKYFMILNKKVWIKVFDKLHLHCNSIILQ